MRAIYIEAMSVRSLINPLLKHWPIIALATSAGMLAIAHGFEQFGSLSPCALCLHQREAYWGAVAIAGLAILSGKFRPDLMAKRAFTFLLVCAFGAGALIAGFHMGVEFKWWLGLAECAGGGNFKPSADLLGALSSTMKVPACDAVAWSFLGLSMAGWNMIISLGLTAMSALTLAFPNGMKETAHD
jgi:disulfide bond formation protein DsbB